MMVSLESVSRNATARSLKLIEATPEALRECADRLETSLRESLSGDAILCELTPSIHVLYKPMSRTSIVATEFEGGAL